MRDVWWDFSEERGEIGLSTRDDHTSADKPFCSVIRPRSGEYRNFNGSLCNPVRRGRKGNVYSRLRSRHSRFSSLLGFLSSASDAPGSVGRNKSGLANTERCKVLLHSRNQSVGNLSRLFIKRSLLPQQSIILFLRPRFLSSLFPRSHYSKIYPKYYNSYQIGELIALQLGSNFGISSCFS